MRLLYIHGLHSKPRPDKDAILEEFADFVLSPEVNYFSKKPVFPWLLEECRKQKINTLAGSSAGGLMAFWLNKYLGTKALLFNPALKFQSFRTDIIEPNATSLRNDYFNYMVLGEKDQTIPFEQTIDYLKEQENPKNYEIETISDLEHRIDLDTFRYAVEKFSKIYHER